MILGKEYEGVPERFHSVVTTYGRDMFDFVMAVGLAGQATEGLVEQGRKRSSKGIMMGTAMLAEQFNIVGTLLIHKMEWTEERIAECNQAILIAFASGEEPKIQLLH